MMRELLPVKERRRSDDGVAPRCSVGCVSDPNGGERTWKNKGIPAYEEEDDEEWKQNLQWNQESEKEEEEPRIAKEEKKAVEEMAVEEMAEEEMAEEEFSLPFHLHIRQMPIDSLRRLGVGMRPTPVVHRRRPTKTRSSATPYD